MNTARKSSVSGERQWNEKHHLWLGSAGSPNILQQTETVASMKTYHTKSPAAAAAADTEYVTRKLMVSEKKRELLYLEDDSQYEYWSKAIRISFVTEDVGNRPPSFAAGWLAGNPNILRQAVSVATVKNHTKILSIRQTTVGTKRSIIGSTRETY